MKNKPDEFSTMAKIYEALKPFDAEARSRMVLTVEEKLKAEAPKPRGPRKRANVVQLQAADSK